jgi:hypothetical protein
MHRSGRLTLIKTMLSALPAYTAISLGLPQASQGLARSGEGLPLDWYWSCAKWKVPSGLEPYSEAIAFGWSWSDGSQTAGGGIAPLLDVVLAY